MRFALAVFSDILYVEFEKRLYLLHGSFYLWTSEFQVSEGNICYIFFKLACHDLQRSLFHFHFYRGIKGEAGSKGMQGDNGDQVRIVCSLSSQWLSYPQ